MQVFRKGQIELVNADEIGPYKVLNSEYFQIATPRTENYIINMCKKLIDICKNLNIQPPVYLLVTLTDVKGAILCGRDEKFSILTSRSPIGTAIDYDTLFLPDIQVSGFDEDMSRTLKPALDVLWQSAGSAYCPYYNEQGVWRG